MKYLNWEKYNLEIQLEQNLLIGKGRPEYPNGWLLGIVRFHQPMYMNLFRRLTFEEELLVIRNLLEIGLVTDRYPLIEETGQICIYKEKSFVYDTVLLDSVIGDERSFDGSSDEVNIEPIMILPSIDMLGILEDFQKWKLSIGK